MNALSRLAGRQGRTREAGNEPARPSPRCWRTAVALAGLHQYRQNGQHGQGMTLARKLHASHPANVQVMELLAEGESDGGEHAQALEHYSKLAVLQPASATVQMRLAFAHMAGSSAPWSY